MLLQAAVVAEAAKFAKIESVHHALLAPWTGERFRPGLTQGVTLFVQLLEQSEDAGGRHLGTFEFVEPDALAMKAKV